MAKPNTICRVCKNEYFCCSDSKAINSWRTMACSTECYKEYMRRIEEARKPLTTNTETEVVNKMKHNKKKVVNETTVDEEIIDEI